MKRDRVVFVDYFKGISILGIVLFHLIHDYMDSPRIIAAASAFAGAGIHLFNVCSSFGLTLSYLQKPIHYKDFFFKRFVKIYIPYALTITLYFVFSAFTFKGESAFVSYLSHIFLFKMFFPEHMVSFGGHFWYISTIIQFYLSFLLLMSVLRQIGSKKLFIASCVVSFLWASLTTSLGKTDRVWTNFFLQYLWEYGLGFLLADMYFHNTNWDFKKIPLYLQVIVTTVSFLIFAFTGLNGGILKSFNDIFAFGAIGGIYYLIYQIKLCNAPMITISKFSYELYLLHMLVFDIVFALLEDHFPDIVIGVIGLSISLLLAHYFSVINRYISKNVRFCH